MSKKKSKIIDPEPPRALKSVDSQTQAQAQDFGSAGGMEGTTEVTNAHIMNRMWEEETKKFHTEINAPHGMSTFESVVEVMREEFGNEVTGMVDDWINFFKTNMVAFKRKRAIEMVEMMKAEAKREAARLENKITESLNR